MRINEEQFENHPLGILAELGYVYENGSEIAPDTERAERKGSSGEFLRVLLF